MRFCLRRVAHTLFVLWAVSLLSFLFLELAPGDYLDRMRLNPAVSAETLEAMRARYGLDRPFVERYAKWLGAVSTGTWGYSFAYGVAVRPLVLARAANTLVLSVSAALLAWGLALPLGTLWAMRCRPGSLLGWLTSLIVGLPELVLALALLVVAERSRVFPIGGMRSMGTSELALAGRTSDILWHLVLPVLALTLPAFAVVVRHVKSSVGDVLGEPFVLNARALGLTERHLILHHVLRPAANPLISIAGLSIASLVSASFVVEVVMGWPGLGPFLLDAIRARDVHVVIGGVLCSAILVVIGGLFTDLFLYLNDPRIAVR